METPSSIKRVTRSQALAALNNNIATTIKTANINNISISKKIEDSEKSVSKSRRKNAKQQQDRPVLIDITNDSPIIGLAMGNLETPSSAIAKQSSSRAKNNTPGSGEALLRRQVKTLLLKVEKEAELSKLSLESRPFLNLQRFVNSPMGLLAPTPANTPQVPNLSEDGGANNNGLASVTSLPVFEEQMKALQVMSVHYDGMQQEILESQKSLTRSLMLDFSEKSDSSDFSSECSSVLASQQVKRAVNNDSKDNSSPTNDDDASIWSIRVNAGAHNEEEVQVIEDDYIYEYAQDDGWQVDELSEGISNMCVKEQTMAKFTGKHTSYMYNSDDEIVEKVDGAKTANSPNVIRLKGLPTPKGKHLRFHTEEEEEEGARV